MMWFVICTIAAGLLSGIITMTLGLSSEAAFIMAMPIGAVGGAVGIALDVR
jgi:hypothetical protein